jgi:hypothetical protein
MARQRRFEDQGLGLEAELRKQMKENDSDEYDYYCADCSGVIAPEAETCPHCGADTSRFIEKEGQNVEREDLLLRQHHDMPRKSMKVFVPGLLFGLSALCAIYNFIIYPQLLVGAETYKTMKLRSWGLSDYSAYYWDRATGPFLELTIFLFAVPLFMSNSANTRRVGYIVIILGTMIWMFLNILP